MKKHIFETHPERPLAALEERLASIPNKTDPDQADGKVTPPLDCSENCEEAPISPHLEPNRAKENNDQLPKETINENNKTVSSDQDLCDNASAL